MANIQLKQNSKQKIAESQGVQLRDVLSPQLSYKHHILLLVVNKVAHPRGALAHNSSYVLPHKWLHFIEFILSRAVFANHLDSRAERATKTKHPVLLWGLLLASVSHRLHGTKHYVLCVCLQPLWKIAYNIFLTTPRKF